MLISVIICTKNRPESLSKCLNSLKNQNINFETLVILTEQDFKSKEVCKKFDVNYFEEESLGRCGARNTGIRKSQGDIIVFFDDDVEILENCVEEMIKLFENKEVGCVGGFAFEPSYKKTIFHKIYPYVFIKKLGVRKSGLVTGDHKEGNKIVEGLARGYAMAFRRKALQEIKGFDEWYQKTAFREETDVCIRILKKGYKILYNPNAKIIHKCDKKNREKFSDIMYDTFRQNQYFIFKNKLLKKSGIPEYLLNEFLDIFIIFYKGFVNRCFSFFIFFNCFVSKIKGIKQGIKARHIKGIYGDL